MIPWSGRPSQVPAGSTPALSSSLTGAATLGGLAAEQRSLLRSGHLTGLYGPPVVQTMLSAVHLTGMTGSLCEPPDLPHRHLFDSPLQRRRVSKGSPGCGREQPHRTKTRDLRRVDDHRERLQGPASRPDPDHRRVSAPEPAERLLVRRPGSYSPSGRAPAPGALSREVDDLFVAAPPPSAPLGTCAR